MSTLECTPFYHSALNGAIVTFHIRRACRCLLSCAPPFRPAPHEHVSSVFLVNPTSQIGPIALDHVTILSADLDFILPHLLARIRDCSLARSVQQTCRKRSQLLSRPRPIPLQVSRLEHRAAAQKSAAAATASDQASAVVLSSHSSGRGSWKLGSCTPECAKYPLRRVQPLGIRQDQDRVCEPAWPVRSKACAGTRRPRARG